MNKTLNTSVENFAGIPIEFKDTIIFAVTPHKKCVGIKVFADGPTDSLAHNYIDRCVKRALELKSSIENGTCGLEENKQIILNPSVESVGIDFLINSHMEQINKNLQVKHENKLIELGRTMIHTVQMENVQFDVYKICLNELHVLTREVLTPLMLKKNPHIVCDVMKLCRYTSVKETKPYHEIRSLANQTLRAFKEVMGYNGSSEEFLIWFNESVKLFDELTSHISDDERRYLTSDPEAKLTKPT